MADELVDVLLDGWDKADQTRVVQILAEASIPDTPTLRRGPREQRQKSCGRTPAAPGSPAAPADTDTG